MAKNTKALDTGNAGAVKPGKGETFAVTQEAYDVAFAAGCEFAGGLHVVYSAATAALAPLLAPLSGASTPEAVAQWNEYRAAFVLGMADARAIDPDSARRAWGRIVDGAGWVKPQTAEAAAKAAQRAAKASKGTGEGESSADDEAGPKDGAGEAAAAAVSMGLSSMEAHIISLLRAKKFEMAAECIANLAEQE